MKLELVNGESFQNMELFTLSHLPIPNILFF